MCEVCMQSGCLAFSRSKCVDHTCHSRSHFTQLQICGGVSKAKNAGDVHCLLQLLYSSPVSFLPCSHSAESKVAGLGVGGLWLHLWAFALSIDHPVRKNIWSTYSCLWQDTDHSSWREPSNPGTWLWQITSDPETEWLRALPFPVCMVSDWCSVHQPSCHLDFFLQNCQTKTKWRGLQLTAGVIMVRNSHTWHSQWEWHMALSVVKGKWWWGKHVGVY